MPRGTNPQLEAYLRLIYPWDPEHEQLYKSVTWTWTPRDHKPGDKPAIANYAATDIDRLMNLVESRAWKDDANVWVSMGTQRMASAEKYSNDGYAKAVRQAPNMVSYNSIWLDIDAGSKGYATTDDAFAALDDLCDKVNLPPPTLEVLSGSGGLHVIWCTPTPMSVDQWSPLARALQASAMTYGLTFDPQCTVNPTMILRPPNTWNRKNVPPTQVLLMEDSSFARYDYQELVGRLRPFIGKTTGLHSMPHSTVPAVSSRAANFTENVGVAPPVAIDDVAPECGVVSDILDRGGDGDGEPLWNLAIMLASFTTDPVDAAHRLSSGDGRYSRSETDQKLQEKINARASNPSIGWPKCQSFSQLHTACALCPHFIHNKSPLNFAKTPVTAFVAQQQAQAAASQDPLMPQGYYRDIDKHVCTVVTNDKGETMTVDVLGYPILDAGLEPETGALVVRTRWGGVERWGAAAIGSNQQPVAAAQTMAKGTGIYIKPINHRTARDFLVTWMQKLQEGRRQIGAHAFGWNPNGFTFGEHTYLNDGGQDMVFRGSSVDTRFMAHGELKPWQDSLQLVAGNAPLETVVASAFAAPLVELVGQVSLVLSIYSELSGVGKSTSMQIAQAVWGNPRTGMSSLNDTQNSVMKKIADLRSLPVYWDELRTFEQVERIVDLIFSVTQGKGKARLTRDIVQQDTPAFTTMFVVASNYGLSDNVYRHTEATEAGGLRLFEIEANPLTSSLADHQARQLLLPLASNYGCAGAIYARYLATNKSMVQQALVTTADILQKRYQFNAKERFWAMTYATLIMGAHLANQAGLTKFDVQALDTYLEGQLAEQRKGLQDQSFHTMSDKGAILALLGDLLQEHRLTSTIITDRIHYGTKPLPVKVIDTDVSKLKDVWIQHGLSDGRYRIRLKPFVKWLEDRKLQLRTVEKQLSEHFVVTKAKRSIGVGVPFLDGVATAARSICIDLTPLPNTHASRDANRGS